MLPNAFPHRLVILGGGTAGWMAAAYLDRNFNRPDRKRLRITLVEAPAIGRIGVGEATIPSLRGFCEYLGIDEDRLMQRTGATFKHGVSFEGWNGPDTSYFHPFEALDRVLGLNAGPAWLARRARGVAGEFQNEIGIQARVAYAGLAPKPLTQPSYMGAFSYAYHLDAEAFADLLQEVATARGVEHIRGEVTAVEHEDGDVHSLELRDGQFVEGDFFIDCSGFSQMLIGGALATPIVSFADHLICDRAIALQIPYSAEMPRVPYTRAIAASAGWRWQIGLQSRMGAGYVYSSAFQDDDGAEAELRAALGIGGDIPARRLKFKVGRPKESWSGNVVALGLAGGFIEPLESTSISLIEIALELLVRYFPLSGANPAAREQFNFILNERYTELRDFIVMHYCLSQRRDTPFWREVTSDARIPESLRARLELWRDRHPAMQDFPSRHSLFSHHSWESVLYGMDAVGGAAMANADYWLGDVDDTARAIEQAAAAALADLPTHDLWLEGLQSMTLKPPVW